MALIRYKQNLEKIVDGIIYQRQIYKKNLRFGDLLIITTMNSEYNIFVLESGFFLIMGGWFDQAGLSPAKMGVKGCSWGGNIIKIDIIAACGLHLEFSNGLRTSIIRKVIVCPRNVQN
jgi:hypothetical protein